MQICTAKTGTSRRMKHLPILDHHVLNEGDEDSSNNDDFNARFGPSTPIFRNASKHQKEVTIRGEKHATRCVYNYEDRYRFSGILNACDLVLHSHFESGNLFSAHRVWFEDSRDMDKRQHEYDFELHHDIHSAGHIQWFYFSCANTLSGRGIKFNITNFAKTDSLYNYGMKLLFYSEKSVKDEGVGWQRTGNCIQYYPSSKKNNKQHHTLTFTHTFEHSDDRCYFCCSFHI